MEMIVDFIALAVILLGVVMVYDARNNYKKNIWLWRPKSSSMGTKNIGIYCSNNRNFNFIFLKNWTEGDTAFRPFF